MARSARPGLGFLALIFLTIISGCPAEEYELDQPIVVSGTVTYRKLPVKMGTIHFLPTVAGGLPATGTVVDGQIKDVHTRTPGDGIIAGKYRIAISTFDQAFLETTKRRDYQGPDPSDVAQGAAALRNNQTIPTRYSNAQSSGLVEVITRDHHVLNLELAD